MIDFNEKCIVYKKGSKGEIKHEFNSVEQFYRLEKKARSFKPRTRNDEAKRAIYNILNGTWKSMTSEYLGYDITIRIKK